MKYLIFVLLLGSLVPFTAKADMLRDGYHGVTSCITLDNASDYSDYTFYLVGEYKFPFALQLGEAQVCGLSAGGKIVAVANNDADKIAKETSDSEQAGNWPNTSVNEMYVIWSAESYSFTSQLPDTDTAEKIEKTIHIDKVTSDAVATSLVSSTTTDKDGLVTSEMSAKDSNKQLAIIIVVVLGLLGLIFASKKWTK